MTHRPRPPLREIRILMPVWGRRYARQLLELGLPSLLSEGNIPTLAGVAPSTFVLMTRARDAALIESHPVWHALRSVCSVEVQIIDDLISDSSATVLTLAYARAIRASALAIDETCFFFLVSDYVVATNSLINALARITDGADAVLAGNFQIALEGAESDLLAARSDDGTRLQIAPRRLVEMGLDHLHPATVASTVDGLRPLDIRSNRLFWRVGSQGLVGRFYLMHMVAIRPTIRDFLIAAPSDYALVPELCPSGRVDIISDSDEYCTAELQPAGAVAVRSGEVSPAVLGRAISEWATAQHCKNSHVPLLFHTGEIGDAFASVTALSQGVIDGINRDGEAKPQPYRHHPFWERMLDHHSATAANPSGLGRIAEILGYTPEDANRGGLRLGKLRRRLLGRAPELRVWHPRWADFAALRQALNAVGLENKNILVIGTVPHAVLGVLTARAGSVTQLSAEDLHDLADAERAALARRFDRCVILARGAPSHPAGVLAKTAELLIPGAKVVISIGDVLSEDVTPLPSASVDSILNSVSHLYNRQSVNRIRAGVFRIFVQQQMMRLARSAGRKGGVLDLAPAAVLAALSAISNAAAFLLRRRLSPSASSSMVIILGGAFESVPKMVAGETHRDAHVRTGQMGALR